MMRPIREDHPNFDGGNTQSLAWPPSAGTLFNNDIAIPYWEAVGPWDVDNDNDGVPDSVWIDLGEPVQELEDGTRVKALYATLIIDLDSRLNVNAHGLVDHINPANLGYAFDVNGNPLPSQCEPGRRRQPRTCSRKAWAWVPRKSACAPCSRCRGIVQAH